MKRTMNLFKAIKRSGAVELKILSEWIGYLKSQPYDARIEKLNELAGER